MKLNCCSKSRKLLAISLLLGSLATENLVAAEAVIETTPEKRTRFASTVQLALQEANPLLMNRAQKLVIQEFEKNVDTVPLLRDARMSIQKSGNEVVFSLLTNDDLRVPMRQVLMHMIQSLNGKVRARGRTSFYRTSFSRGPEAELSLTVHDPKKGTLYIDAKQAPLIDLLQEMRRQIPGFSYIIPQECAQRRVYWTFGDPHREQHPENLELKAAMRGIGEMLQIKVEDLNGAFVFSGDCRANSPTLREQAEGQDAEWGWPAEILPMRWPSVPRVQGRPQIAVNNIPVAAAVGTDPNPPPLLQSNLPVQVFFPVTPIDYEH